MRLRQQILRPELSASDDRRKPPIALVLVVLMIVPAIYASLLTWANLDVTTHLDRLPAAVVDLDQPVQTGSGKSAQQVALGKEITESLTTSDNPSNLDWHETTAAEAKQGLADGDYYAVLTLPRDLSSAATSSEDADAARVGRMSLETDDAVSYLSGTIANTIGRTVTEEAAGKVTAAYLNRVYLGFDGLHTQLGKAGEGAGSLAAGAQKLTSGADQASTGAGSLADGLQQLESGSDRLASGTSQLADGAGTLSAGSDQLSVGATRLADGLTKASQQTSTLPKQTQQLADGGKALTSGAATVGSGAKQLGGAGRQLADGATTLGAGVEKLATGAVSAATGADQVAAGAVSAKQGASKLSGGVVAYTAAVDQLSANCVASGAAPAFCQQLAAAASQSSALRTGAGELSTGLTQLETGSAAVATGVHQVSDGATTLSTGASTLSTKAHELGTGADQLAQGGAKLSAGATLLQGGLDQLAAKTPALVEGISDASAGASKLATGADSLSSGADKLSSGAKSASSGAAKLATGAGEAESGAQRLATGAQSLADGSQQLADGAQRLSDGLTEGEAEVPAYSQAERDHLADVVSTPITSSMTRANEVPAFGYGLAPLFISIGLWVGGMALYMILRPNGYLVGVLIGIGQVAVVTGVLVWGLDFEIASLGRFLMVAVAASLTFVAINYSLVRTLGSPGRFVGLLLVVLQIAAAGATYPTEATPGFFQFLHPLLPLSHSVIALRQTIAGGTASLAPNLMVLAAWGLGALLISWIASYEHWSITRQRPSAPTVDQDANDDASEPEATDQAEPALA